jgi:hypothetical protein
MSHVPMLKLKVKQDGMISNLIINANQELKTPQFNCF